MRYSSVRQYKFIENGSHNLSTFYLLAPLRLIYHNLLIGTLNSVSVILEVVSLTLLSFPTKQGRPRIASLEYRSQQNTTYPILSSAPKLTRYYLKGDELRKNHFVVLCPSTLLRIRGKHNLFGLGLRLWREDFC